MVVEKIKNAKTLPKIYFGLHMTEGVAEYVHPNINNGEPHRLFVGEDTIKSMDRTFAGRPVYVKHVSDVDLDNLQSEADGYVIESFFNKSDGKHWVKFIVVSDDGHEHIAKHWKLSNAYNIKESAGGGKWHGVEYLKEVKSAEYDHLAIVQNPRYEESIILTPEEFKAYNDRKEAELLKVANSIENKNNKKLKGEGMFNFFKREKVENSTDLEGMMVILPKSKKEMALADVINGMDKIVNMQGYANGDHMVKVGDEEMSVNELVEKFNSLCEEKKNAQKPEDEKKPENEEDKDKDKPENEEEKPEDKPENEEDDEDKAENEDDDEKEEGVKNSFEVLSKAEKKATVKNSFTVDLSFDKLARGKSRYGSN